MRNIILGIDGIPFELIDHLSNKGVMPNFKDLKKKYTFKLMKSSIPAISSISWSSIITGKNPGEHGIFGFTEIIKNTYSLSFPNFNTLKSQPFWHQFPNRKSIIVNVPATYPAKKLNGIHIAGFVALDINNAVYPDKYISELKNFKYEIDVDSKLAHQQSKDIFIDELFRVLKIRKKVFNFFWNEIKWDFFMPVVTGSDRICHFLWNAYEDEKNQYHHKVLAYFSEIDKIIGEIQNKLNDDDRFIILSDHGMELIDINVNLNTFLEQEGFILLNDKLKNYNRIMKGSKAFVLDPGRIYLNLKGKFPNGTVEEKNKKDVIEELKLLFSELRFKNQKVIKNIYEKEEIYSGKMIDNAPDLVIIENKGYNLKTALEKKEIFEEDKIFSGKHNQDSFILLNRDIDFDIPKVEDVIKFLR